MSTASRATRRQFLSGVAVGVTVSACAGPASRGTPTTSGGSAGAAGTSSTTGGTAGSAQGANAGAGAGQGGATSSIPTRKTAQDRVLLGTTGIQVSRLAMGSGTRGSQGASDQTRLGMSAFSGLLVQSYDQGITFWETADQYGAHAHLRDAIRQVGRQNVVILTKTHARTSAEMQADLARFLTELGTDYIDIVLLHALESSRWTEERSGAMDYAAGAKQRGMIRSHGVSCHSLDALRLAARTPWVDVDLARVNPSGVLMDADPATVISVLEEMKAANKGVIGMKILGEGQLAGQLDMAIEHAVRLDCLDAFTIGFTSRAQLDEVTTKIAAV